MTLKQIKFILIFILSFILGNYLLAQNNSKKIYIVSKKTGDTICVTNYVIRAKDTINMIDCSGEKIGRWEESDTQDVNKPIKYCGEYIHGTRSGKWRLIDSDDNHLIEIVEYTKEGKLKELIEYAVDANTRENSPFRRWVVKDNITEENYIKGVWNIESHIDIAFLEYLTPFFIDLDKAKSYKLK